MSYIPKQERSAKERVEAKLDVRLVEYLTRYCEYLESDRDYVIAQALELVFRKDRGFTAWLESHPVASEDSPATAKRPRKVSVASASGEAEAAKV